MSAKNEKLANSLSFKQQVILAIIAGLFTVVTACISTGAKIDFSHATINFYLLVVNL